MPDFLVTDEMCDRALAILHPGPGKPAKSERDWIRPALAAAIGPDPAFAKRQIKTLQDLLRRAEEKNRNQTVIVDTSKDVARIVSEHWRRVALRETRKRRIGKRGWSAMAEALNLVLAALDGEREPEALGLDRGNNGGIQVLALTDQDPNPIQTFSRYPDDA